MPLKDIVVQGWESLMRNRLRSALTLLGIVWGLVSVVILVAYGGGLGNRVFNAFLGLGNDVVIMEPGQTSMQAGGERAGRRIKFTYDDVQAVRDQVPIARNVSAESDNGLGYKINNRVISVMTKAIEYPYGAMRKLEVEDGRYFEESDFTEGRHVVIFGADAAKKVFNGAPAAGEEVDIQGLRFEVIGVLRKKIQDSSYNCPDNHCAFIPFPLMRDLTDPPHRDPDMIVLQPVSPDQDKKTIAAVRAVLAERHHFNPNDNKAASDWNTVEQGREMRQFTIALDVLLGLIGALTLGVGGVVVT